MPLLDNWTRGEHTGDSLDGDSLTFPTYRKGTGPGVIVIHEIPGLTPQVVGFAEEVVDAGFTVVLPQLFGRPGAAKNPVAIAKTLRQVCVSREFTKLATARDLTGRGVAAQPRPRPARRARWPRGRCAGHVLHRWVRAGDDGRRAVAAPVLCQPSVPFAVGQGAGGRPQPLPRRPRDGQAAGRGRLPGARAPVRQGPGHRVPVRHPRAGDRRRLHPGRLPRAQALDVTLHRQQEAVDRVLAFFAEKLRG